jgi:hypothetical protein
MNLPRLAAALLVPLAALLHTFGYYASRSLQWRLLYDSYQASSDEISVLMSGGTGAAMAGALSALLIGAALGPAPTAALGLAIYAGGTMIEAWSSDLALFATGSLAAQFGLGLYRPAMIAAAVRFFSRRDLPLAALVLTLCYGGVNLAALMASGASALMMNFGASGASLSFALSAALSLGAAVIHLVYFGVGFTSRDGPGSLGIPALTASAVVGAVGAVGLATWAVATDLQTTALTRDLFVGTWMWNINPLVVALTCGGMLLGLGALHVSGVRLPLAAVAGLGLLLSAVGLLPSFLAGVGSAGIFVVLTVIGAVGEALTWGPLAAAACGGVHFRVAIVPAVGITVASYGASFFSRAFDTFDAGATVGGGVASVLSLGVALAGVALLAAAWPLERWVRAREPEEGDAPEEAGGLDPYGFPVGRP